jgi:hypothetical protein
MTPSPVPAEATQVQMSWCSVPLWLVPDSVAAERLVVVGIPRGQVWTTKELLDLLGIPGLTHEQARELALAKLEVDGVLDQVLAFHVEPSSGETTVDPLPHPSTRRS